MRAESKEEDWPALAAKKPAKEPELKKGHRNATEKGAARRAWEPEPFRVRPRMGAGETSMGGLPDRQENELTAIKAIFEGAVQDLPATGSEGAGEVIVDASGETAKLRSSTPVRRYRVRLCASSGCSDSVPAAATEAGGGPTAELEVTYGRLYPMETPALLVDKVDGLPKAAYLELKRRVLAEVEQNAGEECVYEVCSAISELLRQHHDPSAEMPLHERMRRRQAEEAEEQEEAARQGLEQAQRKAVEEWEQQMQAERKRLQRYQEKRRAAERVGEGRGGGNLDFLPEDSEIGIKACAAEKKQLLAAAPASALAVQRHPPSDELSARFRGSAPKLPADDERSDSSLSSFLGDDSSLGGVVFEAVEESEVPMTITWDLQGLPAATVKDSRQRRQAQLSASPLLCPPDKGPAAAPSPGKAADTKANNITGAGRYSTDFEEIRFLGKGGFGTVTKVRHKVDRQLYAIKRLELVGSAAERERLLQECALLPRLTHLHIVRYYQAWIEMEQVDIGSVRVGASGAAIAL
ncbi:unnamed protein product, partial [Polarella glacialis]